MGRPTGSAKKIFRRQKIMLLEATMATIESLRKQQIEVGTQIAIL